MTDLTRRGLLGGLLSLPAALSLTPELADALPVREVTPVGPIPDKSPGTRCRICDTRFEVGDHKHPFLDFYVVADKKPTPVEVRAQMAASGFEPVPTVNLSLTSGIDQCCTRCRDTFLNRDLDYTDPDSYKKWEARLPMQERRTWQDYRVRAMRTPRI